MKISVHCHACGKLCEQWPLQGMTGRFLFARFYPCPGCGEVQTNWIISVDFEQKGKETHVIGNGKGYPTPSA